MLALLVAVLLATPALDEARAHLSKGNLDGVLVVLLPKDSVPAEQGKEAAAVLLDAAGLADARGDRPLSLQLAQMALRRDPKSAKALRLLGTWSLRAIELVFAVKYGKQWVAVEPGSDEARQFLARAEELEKSWTPPETKRRKRRRQQDQAPALIANRGRAAPTSWGESVQRSVDPREPAQQKAPLGRGRVILYGTSWCGVCTHARSWLNAKGIAFEDKDIEMDRSAAKELHDKQRKQKQRHRGVPVIQVNDTLLPPGFSGAAIEYALNH